MANGLGSHYLVSAWNGGLSVANNQYHRFLLRRSEGTVSTALCTVENITRLLLDIKHQRLLN